MRHAFTLIEVLLALGLAVLIILIGTTAFHAVSETMASVNRLHYQNEQLRAGWWQVIRNADYWENEASPEGPYFRLHNRHLRETSEDHRKAWFAPVVFSNEMHGQIWNDPASAATGIRFLDGNNGTDAATHPIQNPNCMLPHDPRSWYRNHLWASAQPGYASAEGWNNNNRTIKIRTSGGTSYGTPRFMLGDYAQLAATDMTARNHNERFALLDWNGDMNRDIEQVDRDQDGVWTENIGLDPDLEIDHHLAASTRPRAHWQLFQRLGHGPTSAYMPNGSFLILADQDGQHPNSTSAPFYDRTTPTEGHDTHQAWNSFYGASGGLSSNIKSHATILYAIGGGAKDWQNIFGMQYNNAGTGLAMLPQPSTESLSERSGRLHKWYLLNENPIRGNRLGLTPSFTSYGGDHQGAAIALAHPTMTSTTIMVPYNIADTESGSRTQEFIDDLWDKGHQIQASDVRLVNQDNKPNYLPMLTVDWHRIVSFNNGDLNHATIHVEDPDGKAVTLRFTPFGCNMRGARQHWAAQHIRAGGSATSPDQFGNPPVGDFYE